MKYHYRLFGLKLGSNIKLGPLPMARKVKNVDVKIYSDKISKPRANQKDVGYKPCTIFSTDFFYWDMKGIARYKVEGSDTVYIEKYKGASWSDVYTFFMETILSVILIKNNRFIFHASAVLIKGQAYLFCCGSGEGKSTIATFLNKRGFKIIEDDKCFVEWDETKKQFFIENQYPFLELWKPQLNWVRPRIKDKLVGKVRKNIQKYRFDISHAVPKRKVPVGRIYLIALDNFDDDQVKKVDIKGIAKINTMLKFSHLEHMINPLGHNKEQFKFVAKLASSIHTEKLSRSRLTKFMDFSNFIINDISDSANAGKKG